MSLRNRHLACVFLLLSALGAAQASASPAPSSFWGQGMHALLCRHAVDLCGELPADSSLRAQAAACALLQPPVAALAAARVVWTMRPPAANTVFVHACTSARA